MKQIILKVCMMLLAVLCMTACGNSASKGDTTSKKEAQTETKAKALSKSGKDKKSAKKVKIAKSSRKKKTVFTPTSAGGPFEILVVADSEDFVNGAYDSLYAVLTDDVEGVAQSEPCFKVHKVAEAAFSRTLRLCRNIIIIDIDKTTYNVCKFKYSKDQYAVPQIVMTIQAPDAKQFRHFVTDNRQIITDFFLRAEMNRQVEMLGNDHSLALQSKVKSMFGCDIWVPTELNKFKTDRYFLWAANERFRDNVELNLNFVMYSYPYRDVNTFTPEYFIHKRDSVMKANVPGPREGQYMKTTTPFVLFEDVELHGAYAQIVRGLWDIEGYDMGGPFVSIARVDEKNQRVVVVEGFVYYPNHPKRDYIRRLEAALYTLRLPDELDVQNFSYNLDEIIIKPE